MELKQAIAETIQESPIVVGMFFSIAGQLVDRLLGIFPVLTILGFGLGYLLYLWSAKYTEKRS